MKRSQVLSIVVVLLLAGCVYEAPLSEEHNIPIDTAVLGLWEPVPDEGEEPDPDERMMVLEFSDTEYLVHHPVKKSGLYYRAYPIKIGDVSCVQLQVIGTGDGPPGEDSDEVYHVVSYALMDGTLVVKTLNTDLVDDDLEDSESLQKAFLEHQGNKDLFTNPGRFRRVEDR